MDLKTFLLASATTISIASSAAAADAIVAAPSEPDYVRVCDAYGTGYFFIPGSKTCLKLEGYVRFQVDVDQALKSTGYYTANSRGLLTVTAKSDTDYGPLTGAFTYKMTADSSAKSEIVLDSAYLELAGLRAGLFYSWWDDDIASETDSTANDTLFNSISYTYDAGSFKVGLSVDELEAATSTKPNDIGIAGLIGGSSGKLTYQFIGGYDSDLNQGALRGIGTLEAGPGSLQLAAVWASGKNAYYRDSKWAVAAAYELKATEKLTIAPGIEYQAGWTPEWAKGQKAFSHGNLWKAGVVVKYQIADNLYTMADVEWRNRTSLEDSKDAFKGFFRLQRSF